MWPHVNLGGHRGGWGGEGGDPIRPALRYADVQPFLNLRGPDGVFKSRTAGIILTPRLSFYIFIHAALS